MTFLFAKFQQEIENQSGKKLKLRFNNNRSTMLSVKWMPKHTEVSLHRMFHQAPKDVMQALTKYICQEKRVIAPTIRAFIEEELKKLDYSHLLDENKLDRQGQIYNLKYLYDKINQEYFNGEINLSITWFGSHIQRNRSQVTFGLYYDPLKLIKINRVLDHPAVPEYLITYVIYHEMLHFVCPSYIDEKGLHRIHSKEFKEKEMQFHHYQLAVDWIKNHQADLFSNKLRFQGVKGWQGIVNGQTSSIAKKKPMQKKVRCSQGLRKKSSAP